MDSMEKKVLEFTYAEYSVDSPITGLFMIMMSFIPLLIPVVVATQVVVLKSRHHFMFFVGLVVSHESAKLLKKIWKQPRPAGAFLTSYGMPSDHSQFMFFITVYVISAMIATVGLKRRIVLTTSLTFIAVSITVAYSRLYLGVHTIEQVTVGAAIGILLGRGWYVLTQRVLLPSKPLKRWFDKAYESVENTFYARAKRIH